MALGARRGDVVLSVLRAGPVMTLPEVGVGLIAAIAMTRLMSSMISWVSNAARPGAPARLANERR